MPKRPSLDVAARDLAPSDKFQRKTERSHEENQERAYIAASRRTDRSIEARVQSAKMASEIHRKRTGKGFKISEQIVLKEEMYEEEDDEYPRQYRQLTGHLFPPQGAAGDLQSRMSAYASTHVAMRTLAREQEINMRFAAEFPQLAAHIQGSGYWQGLQHPPNASPTNPTSPSNTSMSSGSFAATNPQQQYHHSRSQSLSQVDLPPRPSSNQPIRHTSTDAAMSPPGLSRGSTTPDTAKSPGAVSTFHTPDFRTQQPPMQVDPALSSTMALSQTSSFTTELPAEVKQMANLDWNDPVSNFLWPGGEAMQTPWASYDSNEAAPYDNGAVMPTDSNLAKAQPTYSEHPGPSTQYFDGNVGQRSNVGTPGGGEGEDWNNWTDYNGYAEQQ